MGARKGFGPNLVKLIKERCVPVAIPGGNSQTIQTATGRVLGAPKKGYNSHVGKGLAEFDALRESERRPPKVPVYSDHFIRRPAPPPGGLVLRVYLRGLEPDGRGGFARDARQSKRYSGPQRDFLWLTEMEWKSLLPRNPVEGRTIPLPDPVATRLLQHLSGEIVTLNAGWNREHVRSRKVTLTIESVSKRGIEMKLEGSGSMADRPEPSKAVRTGKFRLLGTLHYDKEKKAFDRFDLVAIGRYRNANVTDYYVKAGQRKELTLGAAFEIAEPGSQGYGSIPWALFGGWKKAPGDRAIRRYFGTNPYATK